MGSIDYMSIDQSEVDQLSTLQALRRMRRLRAKNGWDRFDHAHYVMLEQTHLSALLEAAEAHLMQEGAEGVAPMECGDCRGPDCEGCEQSPHWYWWREQGAEGGADGDAG